MTVYDCSVVVAGHLSGEIQFQKVNLEVDDDGERARSLSRSISPMPFIIIGFNYCQDDYCELCE